MTDEFLITFTGDIVTAHLSRNAVPVNEVGGLIATVHGALVSISQPVPVAPVQRRPGLVSAKQSIKPDFLICLECAKRQKSLRRHLNVAHGLTPDRYRERYGLPPDYPMAAPNYIKRRREIMRTVWLGRKRSPAATSESPIGAKDKGRRRPGKPGNS